MRNRAAVTVGVALFVTMLASNLPAPLYETYRHRFGLSPFAMTAVFATYPLLLIAGLLGLARIPDRIGRRPALQIAVLLSAACSLLFAWAPNIASLFAARALAAGAISLLTAAGISTLVELHPHRDPGRTALAATFALSLSCGVAPFFSGLVATIAPAPLQTAYAVQVVAAVLVAFALTAIPETAPTAVRRTSLAPRRLVLASGTTLPFVVAATTSGTAWMIASLFLSVVPAYVATLLGVHNLALQGALAMTLFTVSPLTQIALRTAADRRAMALGLGLLIVGIAGMIAAVPLHVLWLLAAATVVIGAGQGAAIYGAQALLNRIAIPDRRSETSAVFFAVTYAIVGIPILTLGAIASRAGLFAGFAAVGGVAAAYAGALLMLLRSPARDDRLRASV